LERFEYWYNSSNTTNDVENHIRLIKAIFEKKGIHYSLKDASLFNQSELRAYYNNLIEQWWSKKSGFSNWITIRDFCISPKGKCIFGLSQPLLVIFEGNEIKGVYPHIVLKKPSPEKISNIPFKTSGKNLRALLEKIENKPSSERNPLEKEIYEAMKGATTKKVLKLL
jgi:hypothetical protein